MEMKVRLIRWILAATALAIASLPVSGQTFPGKPVRFISPFAAGGGNDIMARLLGQKLTEVWGQRVVVENRPGANTIIAMQLLAGSPPDGHTIFMASTRLRSTPPSMPGCPMIRSMTSRRSGSQRALRLSSS